MHCDKPDFSKVDANLSYFDFYFYREDSIVIPFLNSDKYLRVPLTQKRAGYETLVSIDRDDLSENSGFYLDEENILRHRWKRPGQKSKFQLNQNSDELIAEVNRNYLSMVVNTKQYFGLVTSGVKSKEGQFSILILNKVSGEWSHKWERESAFVSNFNTWLVWREVQDKIGSRGGYYIPSGIFRFHNLSSNQVFKAYLSEDSEVLDIDEEGWVLYRVGDTLYKAQIQKDSLGKPIKLVTDPAIKSVHWGLWAEDSPSTNMVEP
ncbi:MAG: hypothetical protein Q9N62_05600 [Ghiorsea sp.]|nr:hypothetical protein [Ghiorsea sp.]